MKPISIIETRIIFIPLRCYDENYIGMMGNMRDPFRKCWTEPSSSLVSSNVHFGFGFAYTTHLLLPLFPLKSHTRNSDENEFEFLVFYVVNLKNDMFSQKKKTVKNFGFAYGFLIHVVMVPLSFTENLMFVWNTWPLEFIEISIYWNILLRDFLYLLFHLCSLSLSLCVLELQLQ